MSEQNDPIRRSTALGPPTRSEVIAFHILRVLRRRKPKWFEEVMESSRDRVAAANVRRLHDAEGEPDWERPFAEAEIRLESVAAMLSAETTAPPKARKRKKRR